MLTNSVEQLKEDFTKLRKDEIGEILHLDEKEISSSKKEVLLEKLLDSVDANELMVRSIYREYASRFSLHPTAVEELLCISKTERLRFTQEQKLIVIGYDYFRKWGKTIEYPRYDGYLTRRITPEQINQWRLEHKAKTTENRKKAAKKAILTKKKNESIQKEFYEKEWKQMLVEWYRINGRLGATLQLAYWTTWVSRWAKECQLKARKARTKKAEYEANKEMLYEMKNEAIRKLSKSPYAKLSFYQPDDPHKITHLEFCPIHFELWLLEREFDYVPKRDFYSRHEKSIHKCKNCTVNKVYDYYSLYYLFIQHNDLKDFHFSFHTPYPIGKEFLPDKKDLNKVIHEEQEGMFRFGRTLFEEEKVVFKMKEVMKYFNEAMEKFDLYFN